MKIVTGKTKSIKLFINPNVIPELTDISSTITEPPDKRGITVVPEGIVKTPDKYQYPPEIRAISFMMKELAEYLSGKGHVVTVVTSMPQPELVENEAKIDMQTVDFENSIKVIRAKIPFEIRGHGSALHYHP